MAYEDFVRTWEVFFVDETNLAQPGGTLTIRGPQNEILFVPQNMGEHNDAWVLATRQYDPGLNQIVGFVGIGGPSNPFSMAAVGARTLFCAIDGALTTAGGAQGEGEAGSWTASDGGGQVEPE